MFSLLDAIVDRPLGELLAELHLADDVRDVLLERAPPGNRLAAVYTLARAYEAADRLGVPKGLIAEIYIDAVNWSDQVFHT